MRHLSAILSLALPLLASAANIGDSHHAARRHAGHHAQLAKRANATEHLNATEHTLEKRFSSARWTYYDVGLGACGKNNVASDFIVALNTPQFGGGYPGPHCFQTITMSYNGKTTQATIMDECPGCPYGGLDLSRGLFDFFAPESVGVLYGEWSFGGGGDGGDSKPPPPPPKTTPKNDPPPPEPTSTKKKPTPTPTPTPEVTSTIEKAISTSISISIGVESTKPTSTSSAAAPAATALNGNLDDFSNILIGLGHIAVAGAKSA